MIKILEYKYFVLKLKDKIDIDLLIYKLQQFKKIHFETKNTLTINDIALIILNSVKK